MYKSFKHRKPKVCMDWILDFWTRTPAASGEIWVQVFLTRTGSGLDLDFVIF